jgi:hypothetical protein
VAVFRKGDLDVRFMHASHKLRLLTRENWDRRLEFAKERLSSLYTEEGSPEATLERFGYFEPLIKHSGFGLVSATDEADYEKRINQILTSLVGLPSREQSVEKTTRLNTDIAKAFRQARILADEASGIDEHKVVKDFEIDASQGLTADFALKNGVIHVIATLDLRRRTVDLGTPALKSLMLDKALKKYKGCKRFGAYAVDPDMRGHFSQHLEMLGEHAHDGLWDWERLDERNKLRKSIFDALEHDDPLI